VEDAGGGQVQQALLGGLGAEEEQARNVRPFLAPQAGAEPEPEEGSPTFAATVEEPKKERTSRWGGAGLQRRRFA
jgi:hypothetical protein